MMNSVVAQIYFCQREVHFFLYMWEKLNFVRIGIISRIYADHVCC